MILNLKTYLSIVYPRVHHCGFTSFFPGLFQMLFCATGDRVDEAQCWKHDATTAMGEMFSPKGYSSGLQKGYVGHAF